MDVGVTVAFDFTGTPPFVIGYTEMKKGTKARARQTTFGTPHGEIVLRPEEEGEYSYVSRDLDRLTLGYQIVVG
jgi:nucleoporin POM152